MPRNPQIYVEHILTEISVLQTILVSHSKTSFFEDATAWRAAVYSIQCISEAARRLPEMWLNKFPEIPWSGIKGIGNLTRHEYDEVNEEIIWNTMAIDIPQLYLVMLEFKNLM